MKDRRQSERIQTQLPAKFETGSGVLEGTIINCSPLGCFVQGQVEEPGDEPVRLTIQLPNGTSVQLWGTVAFYLPTMGFGVHFTQHSNEDQSMLDKWRNYLESQETSVTSVTS